MSTSSPPGNIFSVSVLSPLRDFSSLTLPASAPHCRR